MKQTTFLFLGLLAVASAGCGKAQLPFNENVKGVVKLDGEPVTDVRIMFVPLSDIEHDAPNSNAQTDNKGQFQLVCDNKKPGAVVCKHRVIVMRGRTANTSGDRRAVPTESSIPSVYGSVTNSPLMVDITADQHDYVLEMKTVQ